MTTSPSQSALGEGSLALNDVANGDTPRRQQPPLPLR
jgi:hypothetical protein